jgi:LPXTG-site transpeptidase (sortase) family protein
MVLQDQLPTGLVLDSSTADVGVVVTAQTTVTVSIGTMEPGDTATITIYSTVADTAASPSVMTNSACATTSDGEQDCAEATVNIGPDVTGLPDTGIGGGTSSGGMGFPSILGIVLAGALMLLMAAGTSDRRVIIAMLFVVVVIAVVVVGVAMVLMGGEENGEPTDEAESPVETPAPLEETPEGGPIPEVEIEFPPTPTPYVVSPPAAMPYLLIPKLGDQFEVPVPIVEMPIVNRRWDVSGLGYYVGWLEGTTWMDPTWGNTVLAAHVQLGFNNPGPFWGLGELAPGDEIIVVEGDVEHRFEVVETAAVDPDDWSAAAPTDDPMLTLITCTNWDQNYGVFADRMVVRAVPAGMADPASEPMNSAG